LLITTFLSAANLLDVIYYNYAGKRSTADLFSMLGYEQEMGNHWVTYFKDFWWLILILLFILWLANRIFNKIYLLFIPEKTVVKPMRYVLSVALTVGVLVLVARGGIGLRPVGLISIAKLSSPENVGFVSNTAFTMIKSFNDPGLERLNLIEKQKAATYFSPLVSYESRPFPELSDSLNVVVIILESFGNEWLGSSKENESFTPFFDSLCSEGIFFPNGYANGTKSIEAMPAVLASMPTLMETPYITSQYASNKLDGVGFMLKDKGYSSAFFHSAAKGSMNFDGFAALIGLEQYFGKADYPNQDHFDGTWGIFDHYFLPWCAKKMSEMKQPFFNSIFTISSHHPYALPESLVGKVKKGPYPICHSLNYADYALQLFFEQAKTEAWYNNTLFVFVADHSSASRSSYYGQRAGKFSIPILYYMPFEQLPKEVRPDLSQQIDILPSILHLLGYNQNIYAFGQSVFQKRNQAYSISYLEGVYNLYFENYLLTFSAYKDFQLFDMNSDPSLTKNIFDEKQDKIRAMCLFLQAFIQRYNNDLLDNRNHAVRKN
jgi:phosphoglycerol transferase MdoB-like AlkP superfamily enzyme